MEKIREKLDEIQRDFLENHISVPPFNEFFVMHGIMTRGSARIIDNTAGRLYADSEDIEQARSQVINEGQNPDEDCLVVEQYRYLVNGPVLPTSYRGVPIYMIENIASDNSQP